MNRLGIWLRNALLVVVLVLTLVAGTGSSAAASTPPTVTGTLPNGALWIADVPSSWNGILVLYSHGFGPPRACERARMPATQRRASRARLRARRLLVRPRGLLVGAEHCRRRPVRNDRRGNGISPPARARARPRVRHLDGRAGQRARGRAGAGIIDGALSTCGLVAGADPSEQLPARRGVRDREAPHACSRTQARRFREPGRGRRIGSRAHRGGRGRPDDSRRARTCSRSSSRSSTSRPVAPGVPEPAPNDAEAIEAAQYASAAESFPLAQLHPVRPVLDRARGRRQRILDAR